MPPNKQRTERYFQRFMGAYGQSWSNRYPTKAMLELAIDDWASEMQPYSDAEVEAAYKLCLKRYTLAPTLPQFIELCKTAHASKFAMNKPDYGEPGDPNVGKEHVQKMREILHKRIDEACDSIEKGIEQKNDQD